MEMHVNRQGGCMDTSAQNMSLWQGRINGQNYWLILQTLFLVSIIYPIINKVSLVPGNQRPLPLMRLWLCQAQENH